VDNEHISTSDLSHVVTPRAVREMDLFRTTRDCKTTMTTAPQPAMLLWMMPLQHLGLANIAAGQSGPRTMKRLDRVAVAVELQQQQL
jgi:hypothetical protein